MNQLDVPDLNMTLFDGTVVTLDRFPNVKWILKYDWYNDLGELKLGWHFNSITLPHDTDIAVTDEDLHHLTIISGGNISDLPSCPPWPPIPPMPPTPELPIVTVIDENSDDEHVPSAKAVYDIIPKWTTLDNVEE